MLELLITVALVSASVAMLSLTMPKASAAFINSRRRWFASNFADTLMQKLASRPYALLDTTPSLPANFPASGTAAYPSQGCDCSQENMSAGAFMRETFSEGGLSYSAHACVNLVERDTVNNVWRSYCEDGSVGSSGADKGLKRVRVRVQWYAGGETYHTDLESVVSQ